MSRNPFYFISINIADSCITQVSRLILNLLEANCPLDESIYVLESLVFYHSESNSATEVDTLHGAGRETSQGERIYEEEGYNGVINSIYDVEY